MGRVRIDDNRCQGHTLCHITAPDVFGLRDEDGHGMVLVDPLPPELADLARLGALGCPERAIAVADLTGIG